MNAVVSAETRRRSVALGAALVSTLFASGANADVCRPARVVSSEAMPDAWRRAADALVEATATPGRPWSCTDADLVVEVDADGQGATLRLTTSRGKRERRVVTPDDLISTGKAWLSVLPPPEPIPDAPPKKPTANEPPPETEVPRAVLGATLGPRYEAPTRAWWVAAELRAGAPIGAWSLGAWFRVATAFDVVSHHAPPDFTLNEVVLGGHLERRFSAGPVTIRGAFLPAIAVVTMEGGVGANEENGEKFDPRLGMRIGVARQLNRTFALTFDTEGEFAPFGLTDGHSRHIQHLLPEVPSWGVGLAVGVEAWIH